MKTTLLIFLCASAFLFAEFRLNPDANTLWIEDGKNITGWREGLTVLPHPEGGFTLEPSTNNDSGIYVPADTVNYPWLVCEAVGFSDLKEYKHFSFHNSFGMTGDFYKGIYTFRFGRPNEPTEFMRFNLYGCKMHIKYIKLVKKPETYVEVTKVADKVHVVVHLSKPAEDVSVGFYKGYCMPQLLLDGQKTLQLNPTDEDNPVEWVGDATAPTEEVQGGLLVQATILGGDVPVPVWGMLQ